jgi:hypothetical protein
MIRADEEWGPVSINQHTSSNADARIGENNYLRPYLMCQPVFQHYWDVGGNSQIPNAAVMGFRVIVDF